MNKTIHLIFRIISIIFIALGVIFIALVWLKGDKALAGDVELQNKILSPFITMTLVEDSYRTTDYPVMHSHQKIYNALK